METIRARAHWQPLSWSDEVLIGDGKRVGSVTEPDNSFRIRSRHKKGCLLFRHHSHRMRSCLTAEGRWSCWVKRTGECSLLCSDGRHVGINPTWARLSPAAQILCPAVFFSQIPWRKKTGGREGWSRSLKRKLTTSAERQDWNTRSASISPSVTHTQHECHQRVGDSRTSYNDGATFANNAALKFALLVGLLRSYRIAAGDDESASWSLQEVLIWLLRCFNGRSRRQRRRIFVAEENKMWYAVAAQLII